jgi:hypothetical protein
MGRIEVEMNRDRTFTPLDQIIIIFINLASFINLIKLTLN